MMKTPDYDKAARLAVRTLLELRVRETPVFPADLVKRCKNTVLVPYTELALLPGCGMIADEDFPARDAATWRCDWAGNRYYVVGYNPKKPVARMKFTMAHELGHIVLGHKIGQEYWEEEEANHFALHLLFPRPMLAECAARGMLMSETNLLNLTNCSMPCIRSLAYARPSAVPDRYNRELRQQMRGYVENIFYAGMIWNKLTEFNRLVQVKRYMEGYRE